MLFVNPAYAGSRDVLNITGIHREQWTGFDGRPQSTTLSIHSPLSYRSIGLGITAINDKLGPFQQNLFYGDFSYSLRFKNDAKLSFGIKGGLNLVNIGTATLSLDQQNDQAFLTNVQNKVNPNFGAGILYHSERIFLGISTPKFMQNSYDGSATNLEKRHVFTNLGYVFDMSRLWKMRPMVQAKFTEGAPLSLDISTCAIYDDRFFIGAIYRLDAALAAYFQYQVSLAFRLGFASEFGLQEVRNYNTGTFEFMASYELRFEKQGIRSPRYF